SFAREDFRPRASRELSPLPIRLSRHRKALDGEHVKDEVPHGDSVAAVQEARAKASVQVRHRKPSSFGSKSQPEPVGISPDRASIGSGSRSTLRNLVVEYDQIEGRAIRQANPCQPKPSQLTATLQAHIGESLAPILVRRE